jgi:hypothetical protein
MDAAPALVAHYLEEIGADADRLGEREWGLQLPSTKRGSIGVAVHAGERTLTLRAFFMRGPDRAHEDVYRRVLRKNLDTYAWRFAIDDAGDLLLIAQTPLAGLTAEILDDMLGSLCTTVDETYESAVRTGFDVPEGTEFRPPPGAGERR